MTLRKKTLLIISATVLPLILILYLMSRLIVLHSFEILEAQDTRQHVERVMAALTDTLDTLLNTNRDWSAWDDTYAFIVGENPGYSANNLMDEALINLRVNLMLFLDASGQTVFAKAVDLEAGAECPVPQGLQNYLTPDAPLVRHADPKSGRTGILMLPEGPLLLASGPIVTSENEGPSRGTLIMGRYLNAAEIQRLSTMLNLPIQVYPFAANTVPDDVGQARATLSSQTPTNILRLSPAMLAGYGLIYDVYNTPALIIRLELPRTIYQQGQTSIRYFLLFLLCACAVIGLVIVGLIEQIILSRLAHLNQNVKQIRVQNDVASRVSVSGKDELTSLSISINEMLAALEQSQIFLRKLEKAIETIDVGITITDNEGQIVYTNPAEARMHGYAVEELLGKPAKIFGVRTHKPPTIQDEQQTMQTWKRERLNLKKDGTLFPVLLTSNSITDAKGEILGRVVVCEDIRARKEAEAQLLAFQNELAAKNVQLAELNVSKDTFFSIISHDLRGPFQMILGYAQLLKDTFPQVSPDENLARITQLHTSADYLYRLLENLLTWSRMQRGVMEYTPENLDLQEIVINNLEIFVSQAEQKGVRLEQTIPHEMGVVADFQMLNTILRNLISNAVKFTPSGGTVRVSVNRTDQAVEIAVADTGTGMDAASLAKLFRLDVQYTNLGTAGEKGTGLGLKLCKDLVEKHGGRIWAESAPGEGTTFRLTLLRDADVVQ